MTWHCKRATSQVALALMAVGCLTFVAGCGGGGARGKVKGKVVAGGQPVTGGQLQFAPVAEGAGEGATNAIGTVKPDGTFELMTDKPGDGAAIGKHKVLYTAPPDEQAEWDGYGTAPPVKASPFKGLAPKEAEVEVKSGSNDLTIELVPAGAAGGS